MSTLTRTELVDRLKETMDSYRLLLRDTTFYEAIDTALDSIEPLSEAVLWSTAADGSSSSFTLPSDTYSVEEVSIKDTASGHGAANVLPPTHWRMDHGDKILYLLKAPSSSSEIWVAYRKEYDWSTPGWLPASIPYNAIEKSEGANNVCGFAQSFTVTASTTISGLRFYMGWGTGAEADDSFDLCIYEDGGGGGAPTGECFFRRAYPCQAYMLPIKLQTFTIDPVTLPAGTYWNTIIYNDAIENYGEHTYIGVDSAATIAGSCQTQREPNLGWSTESFDFGIQYQTSAEDIELDPEYIREYALYILYEKLSAVSPAYQRVALERSGIHYKNAMYRKETLMRVRQQQEALLDKRGLDLGV